MPAFGRRSRKRLATAHIDLQILFFEVVKEFDCTVLCGHRTKMEQDALYPKYSKVKWPKLSRKI